MRSLFLLCVVLSLGLGCRPRMRPPVPPDAPYAPTAPHPPQRIAKPTLPPAIPGIRVSVKAYPTKFPVKRSEVIVVAVPAKLQDPLLLPSGDVLNLRQALISGFLRSNYRVKDAGFVESGRLSLRHHPATETDQSSQGKPTTLPGLALDLKDPTSLWAPELLRYRALKAQYFFRVFSVEAKSKVSTTAATRVSDGKYQSYVRAVNTYNAHLRAQKPAYSDYEHKMKRFNSRWISYQSEYTSYIRRYTVYRQRVAQYNRRSVEPLHITSEASLARPPKDAKRRKPLRTLSRKEILERGLSAPIKVNEVTITAEMIQTNTGEVVWAGSLMSVGAQSPRVLVAEALERLAQSSGS